MLVGQPFGPFAIDKELGSGAMGTVYRGRFTKNGQVMAIKVMAPSIGSTNAAALDRFEREITILKQLNHPNIVRFFGAGKHQKMRYFAMEYVEGESLDKVMLRRGRMTWEEVVKLGQQLCAALQHAHEKGIIHRDLKPSNIMVLADGTLKLTDFGIAKDMDLEALTATNCTVGTASYMSPEQCKGNTNLTPKSDLYSLGVLLYELLTGQKPFKADTAMEMFLQHVQGTFERPSRVVLDIPVWLDTLVCQLLEKKPEQRPVDAGMVADTLGTIQEKVEAQQSAGVEAVRRRIMDRAPGRKKPDDEDKEAARLLMTGKGKPKRKRTKKPLQEQVWLRAVGILFLLGVAGTLLYLVFRPPSADKLFKQAEKLMKSSNEEDHQKALDEPIDKYLYHYPNKTGPQMDQILAWRDQVLMEIAEGKLRRKLHMKKKSTLPYHPQEGEENPFAAAEAEDEGDVDKARSLWQETLKSPSPGWTLVAKNHLHTIEEIDRQDKKFAKLYEEMRRTEEEPTLEGPARKAFLGWRAEQFGDPYLAATFYDALKEETAEKDDTRMWYLYAAGKRKKLPSNPKEEDSIKLVKQRFEEDVKIPFETKKPPSTFQRTCLDILALYKNVKNKEVQDIVAKAQNIREQLDAGQKGAPDTSDK